MNNQYPFNLIDQTSEEKQMIRKVPEDWVAWEVDWKNRQLHPLIKRDLTTGKNYVINITR